MSEQSEIGNEHIDLLVPLEEHARTAPDAPALRSHGHPDMSFQQLISTIRDTQSALFDAGVCAGSRVAIILPNSPETAVSILAIASCATAIPLNPAFPARELQSLLAMTHVTHVLSDNELSCQVGPIEAALGATALRLGCAADRVTGSFSLEAHVVSRSPQSKNSSSGCDRTSLVLHTSGSTGRPKRVPLTAANLFSSAWNVARSLELGADDTCLNMMPMFHIGALVDLLLAPLYAGGSVAFAKSISAKSFLQGVRYFQPSWFQAVPTVLADIQTSSAATEEIASVSRLRLIRAVSQPLSAIAKAKFEQKFGVPLIPIYGMTETAGLVSSMPLQPKAGKEASVGIPHGADVRIVDGFGNEVPSGTRGEVLISGPGVLFGYETDGHEASGDTFRGRWFRSGDEGYIDEDGYLFLTGRLKDLINRGGEKISPIEIDQVLMEHPAIREAAAFSLPHPTLGEEIAVAIVRAGAAEIDAGEVRSALRGRLAEFKIPRLVYFLTELPRLPSGKLDRLALPKLVTQVQSTTVRTAPHTPLSKKLAAMWRESLGVRDIANEDDFFDLGGDSLSAVNFATLVEQHFGSDIPVELLFEAPTLRGMEATLSSQIATRTTSPRLEPDIQAAVRKIVSVWRGKRPFPDSLLVGRNTVGTKRPFFWVSQSLQGYDALAEYLDPDRPLYGMTSLSRTGLKSDENTKRLARHYAEEICRVQNSGPYLLGGFCQGGVVAFEIAKVLRAQGQEIASLCLQDRFVPEPYDGRVAFFWGKGGINCAYHLHVRPERGWSKYYSGSISVHRSDADHCDLHNHPHIEVFASQLEDEFRQVERQVNASACHWDQPLLRLDNSCYRARVRARAPIFARQGSEHLLRVEVKNESSEAWEPTSLSGIILAARWHAIDRRQPFTLDGRCELPRRIDPGRKEFFNLPVRVPMRSFPMRLEIDLVEDGIAWFADVGTSGTKKLVVPLRPR